MYAGPMTSEAMPPKGDGRWYGYQMVARLRSLSGCPVLDGPPLAGEG